MVFSFDREALRQILEENGYDAVIDDVASGRRERGNKVYTIDIDQGGRVKFVRTEMAQEPIAKTISAAGRTYHVVNDRINEVTITTELQTPAELRDALPVLEQLANS